MANVQHGTVVGLRKFRAYYEGSDNLYQGMVLAFNYDTTDNYLGTNKANTSRTLDAEAVEGATTADGYQNEGKFMRMEKLAAANINHVAGIVTPSGNEGKAGPYHVDIYDITTGGVVAVRSASNVTANRAMFITAGSYTVDTTGDIFIGYSMETVDRSGTNGLVLVKLALPAQAGQIAPVAKTAAFTLDAGDHGKVFTNTGDADALTVTLPAASTVPGLRAKFVVDAVQNIALSPAVGDKIVFGNDADACADGEDLTLTPADGNDAGMNIEIVSDGDNWQVVSAWAPAAAKFVIP